RAGSGSLDFHWGLPFRSARLQLDEGFRRLECRAGLGPAPEVDHGDLLHAGDRAARGAGLVGKELVLEVGWCVLVERDGGVAPLLRTVVDQPVFADVEVAAAGAAAPVVGFAERYIPLEIVEPRVGGLAHSHDLEKDLLLALAQRLELPRTVVQDSDRARQAQRQGPARDR